jgi:DNA-directed RNA polymerase omega subunit
MRDLPEKIDSKFRFVLLSAQRSEQIMRGAQPRVDAEGRKLTSVAMDEILTDMVSWDYGPEVVPDDDALGGDALGGVPETVSSDAEPESVG